MLVGHEAARGHESRLCRRQLLAIGPGAERRVDGVGIEARDRGPELRPGIAPAPHEARAARGEQPLMRPAGEKVSPEPRDIDVLIRKSVHAIDDQKAPIGGCTPAIGARHNLRSSGNRQLDARRGLDPRHAHRPSGRCDRAGDAVDDLGGARRRRLIEQRDVAHGAARSGRRVADRLVMRIVIVLRGDDLLIAADAQAVVDHRQPGRGVGREGDLGRAAARVLPQRALHRGERPTLGIAERRDLDPQRVRIELLAEMIDCFGYRLRVGDKEEAREVRPIRREREEVANRRPVGVPAQTVQWSRPGQ